MIDCRLMCAVLVVGGSSTDDLPAGTTEITAEVYDPSTGAFTGTGSMAVARIGEFAVSLLADGRGTREL
jgi:hypothetical protein